MEDDTSSYQAIQRAKMRAMQRGTSKMDWNVVEESYVTQWYVVSKIMRHLIPRTFPWCTFDGLVEEIAKDPNYKKKDEAT